MPPCFMRKYIKDQIDRARERDWRPPQEDFFLDEPLTPVKPPARGYPATRKILDGKLTCITCLLAKSTTEFLVRRSHSRRYHDSRCHDCRKLSYIARNHGLTLNQYIALLREEDGRCAVCRQETALHLDHCHTSGKLRGLLCVRCKTALGNFRGNPELIKAAWMYVEHWEAIHATQPQTEQDRKRRKGTEHGGEDTVPNPLC
jgi:hypothetical protein